MKFHRIALIKFIINNFLIQFINQYIEFNFKSYHFNSIQNQLLLIRFQPYLTYGIQ